MKILVPIDFSEASDNAALYAANFAKMINAEIILFNIVHFVSVPMAQVPVAIEREVENGRVSIASERCSHLTEKLKSTDADLQISSEVISGYPIQNVIEEYAVLNQIDLIVMGTSGACGMKKLLFGSNAVFVINKSSIPVITVPIHSNFNDIKKILYASDMLKIHSEIKQLIPFAQLFNASIHILHIEPVNSKKDLNVDQLKNELVNNYGYNNIHFHLSHDNNIVKCINANVKELKIDLLAMYTHELTFLDNLLGNSFCDEMAFQSVIPLLTLRK